MPGRAIVPFVAASASKTSSENTCVGTALVSRDLLDAVLEDGGQFKAKVKVVDAETGSVTRILYVEIIVTPRGVCQLN